MRKMLLLLMLPLLVFCAKVSAPPDGAICVNGKWINRGDIEKYVEQYRQQMMQRSPQMASEAVPPEFKKRVAMQFVDRELVLAEAKKRHISCDSAKLESTFNEMVRKQFPDLVTMQKAFAARGLTEQTVRSQICEDLVADSLMSTIVAKADTATTAECKAYYDANKSQFPPEQQYRASQILLLTGKDATPEKKKDLAEKANKILAELRAGKDFASLAKKYSQDPNAASGGDIGWFKRGDFGPDIEQHVVPLKKGEISDVFETDVGCFIVKKTDERTLPPKTFDEVKGDIKKMMEYKKKSDVAKQFVDSLYRIAKVTWADSIYKPSSDNMGKK